MSKFGTLIRKNLYAVQQRAGWVSAPIEVIFLISVATLPIQLPISVGGATAVIALGDLFAVMAFPLVTYSFFNDPEIHYTWATVLLFLASLCVSIIVAMLRPSWYFSLQMSVVAIVKIFASVYWCIFTYSVLRESTVDRYYRFAIVSVGVAVFSSLVGIYDVFLLGFQRTNGLTQGHRIGVNSFSNYLLLDISLLMGLNEYVINSIYKRVSVVIGFCILLFGVLATGSRSALGAAIILFGLYYVKLDIEGRARLFKIAGIPVVATGIVYFILNPLLVRRFTLAAGIILDLPEEIRNPEWSPGFGNRLVWWKEAVIAFIQRPVFGIGFGQFQAYNQSPGTPHNQYIKFLSESGIIGLTLYTILHVQLARISLLCRKLINGISIYMLFYLISTAAMGLFLDIENFRQFWVGVGVVISIHEYHSRYGL